MRLLRRSLLATLAMPALAQAQWTPSGPIRLIVPFGTGGSTDIIARLVADQMGRHLGQPVVVENRPGAGATLGTGMVAQARPDGQTLLISVISSNAVGHTLYRDRINWHGADSFAHIAIIMGTPYLLLVNPRQPMTTLAQYIEAAKARPGALTYGTSGVGSMPHLVMIRFAGLAGIEVTHVPYRGGAQAATDAVAGVVPSVIDSLTAAITNIRSGALRALAHTRAARVPEIPEVPTFAELGFPQLVVDGWAGIAAPAGTPQPVQERLAAAIRAALEAPLVRQRYAETSTGMPNLFLGDAQRFVEREIVAWAEVVRASGAAPD
jgi:tripartite-type tricarboxylate transporter receptor subunit TctC